jgi:hypothetical protein
MRAQAMRGGVTLAAAVLYYAFIAPGVLVALSLAIPSPLTAPVQVVALGWVLAEAVAIGLPFAALALVVWWRPSLLPRYIWLAPLAAVVVPVAGSALLNLLSTGMLKSDLGIGGELVAPFSIAVEFLAVLLGSALVIVAQNRQPTPARFRPTAAGTHR